jgi:cyanate permease
VVMLIFGYGVFEVLMVRVLGDYQQAQGEGVLITIYGITMLLCALGGGVISLIALLRRHERSSLVWLAMLPGLAALVFLIGELLGRW